MDSPRQGLMQRLRSKTPGAKISGSRSYPVILGYFSDSLSTFTRDTIQARLFNTGNNAMSVNNYFRDMSYNAMSCSGSVASWVNSGHTMAYFGNGANGLPYPYTDTVQSAYGFIKHTLIACDGAMDFSNPTYDQDEDGYVDVLWVVHAGRGGEEEPGNDYNWIWSHSWNLSYWCYPNGTEYTTNDLRPGHPGQYMKIDQYIIMPEKTLWANGISDVDLIGCGVFCHEFGHALGLPDLYDTYTSGSVYGYGLGTFTVMAVGSWGGDYQTGARPVSLDIWSRTFLGWITPFNVTQNGLFTFNLTLPDSHHSAVRMANLGSTSTSQYWLVENRYQNAAGSVSSVKWDSLLFGSGLCIYHIDTTYSGSGTTYFANNSVNVNSTNGTSRNRPLGVALEETDQSYAGYNSEIWFGTNYGEAVDVWNSGTQTSFDSTGSSYPCSFLNNTSSTTTSGGNSGIAIRGIPSAGKGGDFAKTMQCTLYVIPGGPMGVELSQFSTMVTAFGITLSWRTESETECLNWEIERSRAATEEYALVGTVDGHGTTSEPQEYEYCDVSVAEPGRYHYRLAEVELSGRRTYYGPIEVNYQPAEVLCFRMVPLHPNPCAGAVLISYSIGQPGHTELVVYNVLGQEVRTLVDAEQKTDRYQVPWDGRNQHGQKVAAGVYLVKLRSGAYQALQRLTVLR